MALAAKEFVKSAELETSVGLQSLLLAQQFIIGRRLPQGTLLSRRSKAHDEAVTPLVLANPDPTGPVLSSHLPNIVANFITSGTECE
jgi:hypothetical protein